MSRDEFIASLEEDGAGISDFILDNHDDVAELFETGSLTLNGFVFTLQIEKEA